MQPHNDNVAMLSEWQMYLRPTYFVDSDHPDVQTWAEEVVDGAESNIEKATKLYYGVRDGIFYNPYRVKLKRECMTASYTLQRGRSFCVPKAVVMAAGARAVGIPCRLGFADVRNHLTSSALRDALGSDIYAFHGYVELWLQGKWIKATPTFNLELCERAGVKPLDFDGRHHAIFQEYNLVGDRLMEYVHEYGVFADLPYPQMLEAWHRTYPHLFEGEGQLDVNGDLMKEILEDIKQRESALML